MVRKIVFRQNRVKTSFQLKPMIQAFTRPQKCCWLEMNRSYFPMAVQEKCIWSEFYSDGFLS